MMLFSRSKPADPRRQQYEKWAAQRNAPPQTAPATVALSQSEQGVLGLLPIELRDADRALALAMAVHLSALGRAYLASRARLDLRAAAGVVEKVEMRSAAALWAELVCAASAAGVAEAAAVVEIVKEGRPGGAQSVRLAGSNES